MLTRTLRRVVREVRSVTPEGSGKGIGGRGKGKGGTVELADDPRLRDHTTGGEEPSDQEVSDQNENKEDDVLREEPACDYDVQSELLQQPATESNDAVTERR